MNPDDDFEVWRKDRHNVQAPSGLVDRVMAAIETTAGSHPRGGTSLKSHSLIGRAGPVLLWTAASLFFVARIAALVGNLVFPTGGYPEFAVDERIEEVPDEPRNVSRS